MRTAREVLDAPTWQLLEGGGILKPGGHLLAFGGTRTYHRLACAVEDAGFEIRDSLLWLYGSGFPKSLDVSKAIDKAAGAEREDDYFLRQRGNAGGFQVAVRCGRCGNTRNGMSCKCPPDAPATPEARQWQGWGTALKPSHEPIVVARKPLIGTVAETVLKYGTGALNVDGCRIATTQEERDWIAKTARPNTAGEEHEGAVMNRPPTPTVNVHAAGRWPANVILSEEAAAELDAQTGELTSGKLAREQQNGFGGTVNAYGTGERGGYNDYPGDTGGASRFFYCAKTSRAERNAGLEDFESKPLNWSSGEQSPGTFQSEGTEKASRNHHPTIKPIDLMRWLLRMVTPPNGLIVDPFVGSGTTGCAAVLEGFDFVGIEREADYVEIAKARLEWWRTHRGREAEAVLADHARSERVAAAHADAGQLGLEIP